MILVVGATGQLGGTITRRLLEQGKVVRILVRPASSYHSLVELGAQPAVGDLKQPSSLDAACQGIETVITTANSGGRGGDDTVETVDRDGNRRLIDAARAAGVKHFIFTSALGADPASPVPFLQAKGLTEAHLRGSGMPYTILVPNAFMDVWSMLVVGGPALAGQPVTLVGEGRRQHSFIFSGDVAAFALAAVDHVAAKNQTLVLGGPEALSWRDVIGAFERALGREISVQHIAPGEPIPGMPDLLAGILAGFDTYDSVIPMAETAETFGVKLTTIEEFARNTAVSSTPAQSS